VSTTRFGYYLPYVGLQFWVALGPILYEKSLNLKVSFGFEFFVKLHVSDYYNGCEMEYQYTRGNTVNERAGGGVMR